MPPENKPKIRKRPVIFDESYDAAKVIVRSYEKLDLPTLKGALNAAISEFGPNPSGYQKKILFGIKDLIDLKEQS